MTSEQASWGSGCEVCIDEVVLELNSLSAKLCKLQGQIETDEVHLSLQITSPALKLLSSLLGGNSTVGHASELSSGGPSPARTPNGYARARTASSVRIPDINTQNQGTFQPTSAVMLDFALPDICSKANCMKPMASRSRRPSTFYARHSIYIHPDGNFRVVWDTCALWLILVLIISVPFELTFLWETETNSTDSYPLLWWLAVLADCFFFLDVLINCVTAFYKDSGPNAELVKTPVAMLRNYASGWLLMDLVATFPFSRMINAFSPGTSPDGLSALRIVRLAKTARLIKVVRVLKLGGIVQMLEEQLIAARSATVAFHLFKLCVAMLVSCHCAACFWFVVGYASGQCGYEQTWLDSFSVQPVSDLWVASFYFCITTGSTVGYGDIHATNTMEMIAGSFLLACSVLGIGQMIAKSGEVVAAFQERSTQVKRIKHNAMLFMQKRRVPRKLYLKVLRFLDHVGTNDSLTSFEGTGFIEHLSESLQLEMRLTLVGVIIKSFPVFSQLHDAFVKALCQVVDSQRAGVHDIIVEVEQSCDAMFMITSGEFSYVERSGEEGRLSGLDWFGERALFFEGIVYNMTVTCVVDSELLTLRRRNFLEQLTMFPKVQSEYNVILKALKPSGLRRSAPTRTYSNDLLVGLEAAADLADDNEVDYLNTVYV